MKKPAVAADSERAVCVGVTLTGADEGTNLDALVGLISTPGVEIGLLYTDTPEIRNRYPSRKWLAEAVRRLSGRCALHVCGRGARAALLAGDLIDLTAHTPRVQVNGVLGLDEVMLLASRVETLITQHTEANAHLLNSQAANHVVLVDGSGGRGVLPVEWKRPATQKAVGFAGGLGVHSLHAQSEAIRRVARGPYWLDMEASLRVNDWFNIDRAELTIKMALAIGILRGPDAAESA